jgi:RNA polymerase sigma-70 factor (ECF subfamily)
MRRILRKIAINAAIDNLRKRKQLLEFDDNMPDIPEEESGNEKDFSIEDIKQAIEKLAIGYRTITSLYLFEKMSFDEIAKQLKIAASSVRSQYYRALEKLRKTMVNG